MSVFPGFPPIFIEKLVPFKPTFVYYFCAARFIKIAQPKNTEIPTFFHIESNQNINKK